jgi:hypothetical protein
MQVLCGEGSGRGTGQAHGIAIDPALEPPFDCLRRGQIPADPEPLERAIIPAPQRRSAS